MEAVGAVASIFNLVQLSIVVAQTTRTVCQRFQHAPEEVSQIRHQLRLIQDGLQKLSDDSRPWHIRLSKQQAELETALKHVHCHTQSLENILAAYDEIHALPKRARWATRGRTHAETVLLALQRAREDVGFLLQTVICMSQSIILSRLDDIETHISLSSELIQDPITKETAHEGMTQRRYHQKLGQVSWPIGNLWSFLGISTHHVMTFNDSYTEHTVMFRYKSLLFSRVWRVHVATSLTPNISWFIHLRVASARALCRDHPFISACGRSDLSDMKRMPDSREGRLDDVDDRNWTPLAYAIANDSHEMVRELIRRGADIEGLIGEWHTTPLQWAVWHKRLRLTRVLIAEGASQDHVNKLGWRILFFCWPRLRQGERCMLDFLHMLEQDASQDLAAIDGKGWTVLDRVAAFGQPEEAAALLKLGAGAGQTAEPLGWSPIHYAVFYGNKRTFQVLAPYHTSDIVTIKDDRGWTLLHIAASAGHSEIVKDLVRRGAESQARSKPHWSHMSESLYGGQWTPQEVAAAQSPKREDDYVQALEGVCDVFWDVGEFLP